MKDLLKLIGKNLLVFIISFIVVYSLWAFMCGSFDVTTWKTGDRIYVVYYATAAWVYYNIFG